MIDEWGTLQVIIALIGFVSVLVGLWAALMKPAQDNNKAALQNNKDIQQMAERNNQNIQKILGSLSEQIAVLNANLCNLINSDTKQEVRLDRHKDQILHHESRLAKNETRLEAIEKTAYIKDRID